MIPAAQITHWRQTAPWASDDDVEQDLVISRAIVDIFANDYLRERLAFRGGTALHKLMLAPATRYSEDIDLVFMRNEGIGPIFDQTRTALSWIDTKPQRDKRLFPKLYFRFITAGGTPRKIKVEIATREAFSALRAIEVPYEVSSPFYQGSARVRTYTIEELLATKLRALYQRQKGRDLYDLWYAARQRPIDFARVYALFVEYWAATGLPQLRRNVVVQNARAAWGVAEASARPAGRPRSRAARRSARARRSPRRVPRLRRRRRGSPAGRSRRR